MIWAEMITIRSAANGSRKLRLVLQALLLEIRREHDRAAIRWYHREGIDSDFCILLFHEQAEARAGVSRMGLRLAAALKDFGWVNRIVWVECDTM